MRCKGTAFFCICKIIASFFYLLPNIFGILYNWLKGNHLLSCLIHVKCALKCIFPYNIWGPDKLEWLVWCAFCVVYSLVEILQFRSWFSHIVDNRITNNACWIYASEMQDCHIIRLLQIFTQKLFNAILGSMPLPACNEQQHTCKNKNYSFPHFFSGIRLSIAKRWSHTICTVGMSRRSSGVWTKRRVGPKETISRFG